MKIAGARTESKRLATRTAISMLAGASTSTISRRFVLSGFRLLPMLNYQRDSVAGFLIEDDVFTGFCGSKFLNRRLRVIERHCRL